MTEIRFYHLNRKPLLATLAQLCERAIANNNHALIVAPQTVFQNVSDALWMTKPDSFVAHDFSNADQSNQPVAMLDHFANPNQAKTAFVLPDINWADVSVFDLVCHIFEGQNDNQLNAAREAWKQFKTSNHTLTYWQQDELGKWIQKS